MRPTTIALTIAVSLFGCAKKPRPDTHDAGADRAAPAPVPGVTAAPPPAVASAELIAAIADGRMAAARVIDPAAGFYQHTILPGPGDPPEPERKQWSCGDRAAAELTRVAKQIVDAQQRATHAPRYADDPDSPLHLHCNNDFLHSTDPAFGGRTAGESDGVRGGAPYRYAVCIVSDGAEPGASYHLLFVPDAARGLRAAGVMILEDGEMAVGFEMFWADFAAQVRAGGCG